MRFSTMRTVASLLLSATALVVVAHGQDPVKPKLRSTFMRQKLDYSKHVLEGLTTEDFAMVAENAKKLKAMSAAAEWEVTTIPNVEEYLPYTAEFQRLTDDLLAKAKAKNLDGAAIAFNRITMKCVDCHRYVRGVVK